VIKLAEPWRGFSRPRLAGGEVEWVMTGTAAVAGLSSGKGPH